MAYEQKDGQGSLFKNDEKEVEQHPDYKGSIRINGQDYWLSAWLNTGKSGKRYMSLSAKIKTPRHEVPKDAPASAQKYENLDDPLPF